MAEILVQEKRDSPEAQLNILPTAPDAASVTLECEQKQLLLNTATVNLNCFARLDAHPTSLKAAASSTMVSDDSIAGAVVVAPEQSQKAGHQQQPKQAMTADPADGAVADNAAEPVAEDAGGSSEESPGCQAPKKAPSTNVKCSKNGRKGTAKSHMVCKVDGCTTMLSNSKAYYQRHRVCAAHLAAMSATVDGVVCRFCQQCGKFQPLEEFDTDKRSCRSRLKRHNNRRREQRHSKGMEFHLLAAAAAAAAATNADVRGHEAVCVHQVAVSAVAAGSSERHDHMLGTLAQGQVTSGASPAIKTESDGSVGVHEGPSIAAQAAQHADAAPAGAELPSMRMRRSSANRALEAMRIMNAVSSSSAELDDEDAGDVQRGHHRSPSATAVKHPRPLPVRTVLMKRPGSAGGDGVSPLAQGVSSASACQRSTQPCLELGVGPRCNLYRSLSAVGHGSSGSMTDGSEGQQPMLRSSGSAQLTFSTEDTGRSSGGIKPAGLSRFAPKNSDSGLACQLPQQQQPGERCPGVNDFGPQACPAWQQPHKQYWAQPSAQNAHPSAQTSQQLLWQQTTLSQAPPTSIAPVGEQFAAECAAGVGANAAVPSSSSNTLLITAQPAATVLAGTQFAFAAAMTAKHVPSLYQDAAPNSTLPNMHMTAGDSGVAYDPCALNGQSASHSAGVSSASTGPDAHCLAVPDLGAASQTTASKPVLQHGLQKQHFDISCAAGLQSISGTAQGPQELVNCSSPAVGFATSAMRMGSGDHFLHSYVAQQQLLDSSELHPPSLQWQLQHIQEQQRQYMPGRTVWLNNMQLTNSSALLGSSNPSCNRFATISPQNSASAAAIAAAAASAIAGPAKPVISPFAVAHSAQLQLQQQDVSLGPRLGVGHDLAHLQQQDPAPGFVGPMLGFGSDLSRDLGSSITGSPCVSATGVLQSDLAGIRLGSGAWPTIPQPQQHQCTGGWPGLEHQRSAVNSAFVGQHLQLVHDRTCIAGAAGGVAGACSAKSHTTGELTTAPAGAAAASGSLCPLPGSTMFQEMSADEDFSGLLDLLLEGEEQRQQQDAQHQQ